MQVERRSVSVGPIEFLSSNPRKLQNFSLQSGFLPPGLPPGVTPHEIDFWVVQLFSFKYFALLCSTVL